MLNINSTTSNSTQTSARFAVVVSLQSDDDLCAQCLRADHFEIFIETEKIIGMNVLGWKRSFNGKKYRNAFKITRNIL